MKVIFRIITIVIIALSSSVKGAAATASLSVGQTYQTEISPTVYNYLTIESVISTNPSVSVTKMGLVVKATINAYFPGESTITIRLRYRLYAGQDYQYREQQFTIACNDTSISLSPTSGNVKIGETLQMGYSFNRTTYVTPSMTWNSSDESIASVSNSGVVYGKKEGTVTIYAKSNLGSNTATSTITVSSSDTSGGNGETTSNGDKNWYNTLSNEFHISTAEEFMGLQSLVSEGNTFAGKTIYLDNDINLNSLNWTNPIGIDKDKSFSGIIDGQNHNINYKAVFTTSSSLTYAYYGLFGYVNGSIRNLSTTGYMEIEVSSNISYVYIGGIAGYIASRASITNCCNNVSIEYVCKSTYTNFMYIGGIVGYNSQGDCRNCINKGDIVDYSNRKGNSNFNNHFLGGICGVSDVGDIIYCMNLGKIECGPEDTYNSQNNITAIIGGMAGTLTSYSRCLYSGSVGNVFGTANIVKLGGIAGVIQKGVIVTNCYIGCNQLGDCYNKTSSSSYLGLLGGDTSNSATYSYNYVANDILKYNLRNGRSDDTTYSIGEMKTCEFAEVLNSYGSDSHFIGFDELFPLPEVNIFMKDYFKTRITNITCTSALLASNIKDFIIETIKSVGFLIRKDDGKELYLPTSDDSYSLKLVDLEPNRSYVVRWYAQDNDGKEYYGAETTFKTKLLNPLTLEPKSVGVSRCELAGEYYYDKVTKAGFYLYEADNPESGNYLWAKNLVANYNVNISDLKGNTNYKYNAVIEVDGVYYTGDEKGFSTCTIQTLSPNDFTETSATINGEIGIEADDAHFEFRDTSLPSVIDADILPCSDSGLVSTKVQNLKHGNTYKYRIIASKDNITYEGEWVEFVFESVNGIDEISVSDSELIDFSIPYELFNLNGIKLPYKIQNLSSGVYIIKQGHIAKKIRL